MRRPARAAAAARAAARAGGRTGAMFDGAGWGNNRLRTPSWQSLVPIVGLCLNFEGELGYHDQSRQYRRYEMDTLKCALARKVLQLHATTPPMCQVEQAPSMTARNLEIGAE